MKDFLKSFAVVFAAAFFATVAVSYAYSGLVHGRGVFDVGTGVRMAVILAVVIPVSRLLHRD